MKRYAWTFGLIVFIVAVIGAYYVREALDRLPQYTLVPIAGDASAADDIALHASYAERWLEPVTITARGSEYMFKQSYFRRDIAGARDHQASYSGDLARLREEYRGFMRGKGNANGFYEDGEWLVYVDVEGIGDAQADTKVTLQFERLDKSTGSKIRNETVVSLPDKINYVGIRDVQRVGDEIHVLTLQYETCLVYAFGADGMLRRSFAIDFAAAEVGGAKPINTLSESKNAAAKSDYAVIALRNNASSNGARKMLVAYTYSSGELRLLPERMWSGANGDNPVLEHHLLTHMDNTHQELTVTNLDLDDGDEYSYTISAGQYGADSIARGVIADGRLIVLMTRNERPVVIVFDVRQGTVRYEGEVAADGTDEAAAKHMRRLSFSAYSLGTAP